MHDLDQGDTLQADMFAYLGSCIAVSCMKFLPITLCLVLPAAVLHLLVIAPAIARCRQRSALL